MLESRSLRQQHLIEIGLFLGLTACGAHALPAQAGPVIAPGQHIRWIPAADSEFYYGRVLDASDALLRVRLRYSTEEISLEPGTTRALQVRTTARGRSAAIGAGAGAALGAFVGLSVLKGHGAGCGHVSGCGRVSGEALVAIASIGVGTAIGATVGSLVPLRVWREVGRQ